jgi:hypothetical protein
MGAADEAVSRRRFPPEQYPALYMGAREYLALRRHQRLRRRLLDIIGPDVADIVIAIMEEYHCESQS